MRGQWVTTADGREIYVVDYQNLLTPPNYDEVTEKAQEISKKIALVHKLIIILKK